MPHRFHPDKPISHEAYPVPREDAPVDAEKRAETEAMINRIFLIDYEPPRQQQTEQSVTPRLVRTSQPKRSSGFLRRSRGH